MFPICFQNKIIVFKCVCVQYVSYISGYIFILLFNLLAVVAGLSLKRKYVLCQNPTKVSLPFFFPSLFNKISISLQRNGVRLPLVMVQ